MSDKTATNISKFLGLGFGVATVGLAYLCEYFGDTVLQVALSIFGRLKNRMCFLFFQFNILIYLGMLGGPLLGVISLGMFVPQANARVNLNLIVDKVFINLILYFL